MLQLPLEWTRAPILTGKRDKVVSFTCSDDFKDLLDHIVKVQNTDISKLGLRYFAEGISRDIGTMFMAEPYLDNKLRDILEKAKT